MKNYCCVRLRGDTTQQCVVCAFALRYSHESTPRGLLLYIPIDHHILSYLLQLEDDCCVGAAASTSTSHFTWATSHRTSLYLSFITDSSLGTECWRTLQIQQQQYAFSPNAGLPLIVEQPEYICIYVVLAGWYVDARTKLYNKKQTTHGFYPLNYPHTQHTQPVAPAPRLATQPAVRARRDSYVKYYSSINLMSCPMSQTNR